jgi:hypothetical protein
VGNGNRFVSVKEFCATVFLTCKPLGLHCAFPGSYLSLIVPRTPTLSHLLSLFSSTIFCVWPYSRERECVF